MTLSTSEHRVLIPGVSPTRLKKLVGQLGGTRATLEVALSMILVLVVAQTDAAGVQSREDSPLSVSMEASMSSLSVTPIANYETSV